jgi:RNA polymerase sigma-70 factor (ECF subfamily)
LPDVRSDHPLLPAAPAPSPGASTQALTDELLAIRCQLGEPEAFDALIARWHEPLGRYVHRTLGAGQAAEDALQDTWLRVVRALPTLRDPSRLRPWLFGIARRAVMDHLRRDYGHAADVPLELAEAEDASPGDDTLALIERAESLTQLNASLLELPLVEREVLVLFYLQELSLEQLTQVLEVPLGTVKSRLFRARRRLRDHLLANGVHP